MPHTVERSASTLSMGGMDIRHMIYDINNMIMICCIMLYDICCMLYDTDYVFDTEL
jgi:hypothetical protein